MIQRITILLLCALGLAGCGKDKPKPGTPSISENPVVIANGTITDGPRYDQVYCQNNKTGEDWIEQGLICHNDPKERQNSSITYPYESSMNSNVAHDTYSGRVFSSDAPAAPVAKKKKPAPRANDEQVVIGCPGCEFHLDPMIEQHPKHGEAVPKPDIFFVECPAFEHSGAIPVMATDKVNALAHIGCNVATEEEWILSQKYRYMHDKMCTDVATGIQVPCPTNP